MRLPRALLLAGCCFALPSSSVAEVPAGTSPWTTIEGYTMLQPNAQPRPGRTPPVYSWASPEAYRTPSSTRSGILRGLGRVTGLVHNDFLLISNAERANIKTRAFARSLGRIFSGGAAAGGRWGNVVARAGKFGRVAGKAIGWLGFGLMAYELWNLAVGDDGDFVAPGGGTSEAGLEPVSFEDLTDAVRASAPMVMSSVMTSGYNYPTTYVDDVVEGTLGAEGLNGRSILFANPGQNGYFRLHSYVRVAETTPEQGLGGCSLTDPITTASGIVYRRYNRSNCYEVRQIGASKMRVDYTIIDSWPGKSNSSLSGPYGCWVTRCPEQKWSNPARMFFESDVVIDLAEVAPSAPATGNARPGYPDDDMKALPISPAAFRPIIEQALAEAQIAASQSAIDRYTAELVRDLTGEEFAQDITQAEVDALTSQRPAGPLFDYVPETVVEDAIAEEEAGPNPDPSDPPAGGGSSIDLDQEFEIDDPETGFSLPGISVDGLEVVADACPTWVLKEGTERLDLHCEQLEKHKKWLRPMFFVFAILGGLVSFRRG